MRLSAPARRLLRALAGIPWIWDQRRETREHHLTPERRAEHLQALRAYEDAQVRARLAAEFGDLLAEIDALPVRIPAHERGHR